MAYGTRAGFDAVREIAFGSIAAGYTAVGTATTHDTRVFCVSNSTDAEVYVSLNGTTNHLRLAPNSFKLFDVTSDEVDNAGFFIPVGTIFYVKRVSGAPTLGSVWIEVMSAIAGGV